MSACAGISADGKRAALLLSDGRAGGRTHTVTGEGWPWPGGAVAEVLVLDETRNLERVREERLAAGPWRLRVEWNGPGVALVRWRTE